MDYKQLNVKPGDQVCLVVAYGGEKKVGEVFTVKGESSYGGSYYLEGCEDHYALYTKYWEFVEPITPEEAATAAFLPDIDEVREFFEDA